ncbi:3-oxoacyl-ACP synthase III family protein [Planctomicrobium sp. SH661]|uniref:3-oxoacyl-ACP synthase III family protein n=1 Tax=Planctomicrobium sp. SH661 TaxID=3448124 RepID=UPI003F5BC763
MGLKIVDIAAAFPNETQDNATLLMELVKNSPAGQANFERIVEKTRIYCRHVAPRETTALDLAVIAAENLRKKNPEAFNRIDYVIHCTQSPDYLLPTSACLLHSRLKLNQYAGAIDVNLGCSGFVYCLSLADALIRSHHAKTILLTTADTYTHYIHPKDFTNRLIFGDGAAATLLEENGDTPDSKFTHFTNGDSAPFLIVQNGGARSPACIPAANISDEFHPQDPNHLYMNGFEVFKFAITTIPQLIKKHITENHQQLEDYDWFVPHQANAYMLSELNNRLQFPGERVIKHFENIGNTVSASIPLAIDAYRSNGNIQPGHRLLVAGFGIGFSAAVGDVSFQ